MEKKKEKKSDQIELSVFVAAIDEYGRARFSLCDDFLKKWIPAKEGRRVPYDSWTRRDDTYGVCWAKIPDKYSEHFSKKLTDLRGRKVKITVSKHFYTFKVDDKKISGVSLQLKKVEPSAQPA